MYMCFVYTNNRNIYFHIRLHIPHRTSSQIHDPRLGDNSGIGTMNLVSDLAVFRKLARFNSTWEGGGGRVK
jgi:hypothetical protein